MQFFKTPNINFVGARRQALIISLIIIAIGIVSVIMHKGFNQSIDFAGGSLVEVRLDQPVPLQEIRDIMNEAGFSGAEVTTFGALEEVLIKVKRIGEAAEASERIKEALSSSLTDRQIEIRRTETVGPKIGGELRTAAFWSVIYALIGIIVYISWRFEFRFAIAAIIALIHDVLITLGFFSVTNREISLAVIAAILTIVGYSLNDTIVLFDRIRENLRVKRRENYEQLVNSSINEVLSRTIITSLTTLVVVLCLAIVGGEVIRDFALTLVVGVVIGTYSSMFIASPVLILWQARRSKAKARAKRPKKAVKAAK
ncbi:MAG: protein translocase subunit SecF [Candidatus Latescibacteria bacterium]|nr:protein translocase subunit SecF [Candidatus Latescibacterota bacterium]NIM22613.1 protein translocase subunit SecF [Candidatus Latescibacterota bacterium]NIM64902.1 protein translocase subunit SecF [Candidatus Latescibacterota bacterium]NIO01417.1 protein translocase subunit SecF [Candidatus Latescibacterota bacterium]NIO27927.1 protein translocase subunit SecF [Candidatus Latescibacterota bacterium]